MTPNDWEQLPETAGRLADEDRADTSRMLGGCGWYGLGIVTGLFVAAVWVLWS